LVDRSGEKRSHSKENEKYMLSRYSDFPWRSLQDFVAGNRNKDRPYDALASARNAQRSISVSGGEGGMAAARRRMRLRRCPDRTGCGILNRSRPEYKMGAATAPFPISGGGTSLTPRRLSLYFLLTSQQRRKS
jgi:hypothetical protein